MNLDPRSKLAGYIAAAVNEDGEVNRVQLYESLQLDPTDPVAQLVEIFIATTNAQKDIENAFNRQKEQAEGTFLTCVTAISDDAKLLQAAMQKCVSDLAKQREALNDDKAASIEKYGDLLNQLTRVQGALQANMTTLGTMAAKWRSMGVLGAAAAGLVVGTGIGASAAWYFLR